MATQVLIAHTGQRLEVDTAQFSTLDDLKAWVARNTSVSPQHFIALTSHGRSIKFANVYAEKEIYVYDSRTTQALPPDGAPSIVSQLPPPKSYTVPSAPNSIDDVQAITSWQELYKHRRSWAVRLLEDCTALSTTAQQRYAEVDIMIKCMDAAVANIEISAKQLEPKCNELKKWLEPALEEHGRLASSWQQYLALAKNTPAAASIVKFMTRSKDIKTNPTLEDLIELDTAKKAGKLASTAHRRFSDKAKSFDKAAHDMYQGLDNLITEFDSLMNRSFMSHIHDSAQLLQDIEALVRQFDADYHTALSYGSSQRDVAQASKMASTHTERLVPNLKKMAKDINQMVQYSFQARNAIASEAVHFMHVITDITSLRNSVKDQINILNHSEDDLTTFDYLRLLQQVPYMYASFLAETIRRGAWNDKVKTDSSTLANEMALFQDEESKRRKKWQKMVGSTYGPDLATNVIGLEVNVLSDDDPWPVATKEELEQFLELLRGQNTEESILEDITQLLKELSSPTKQQNKRLKAFKMGSVHDASLGRSGLMIRGDDELVRSLHDDKTRLENKLKNADSRVRRLEDLLYRQSQNCRPGNLFQPQSQPPHERKNSDASIRSTRPENQRRSSDAADQLQRRIAQLEIELRDEKQRSSRLEQNLSGQMDNLEQIKSQIQEANSIKNDLLDNLEALKRESVEERKSIEDEMKTLRARLEETEYEIEHFDESREADKTSYDEKIQELEAEIERLNKERQDETLKSQGQVELLRNETRMQREQRDDLERRVQAAHDENRTISKNLMAEQKFAGGHLETLKKLHLELAPDASLPDDVADLADAVLTYTSATLAKIRNMDGDVLLVRNDLDEALNSAKELRAELSQTKQNLLSEESSALHIRKALSEEKAKVKTLEHELEESREQLSRLRTRLSDGASGSETLQKKLEEEERKTVNLMETVAFRQTQVTGLEEELRMTKEQLDALRSQLSGLKGHYENHNERSKDLTQRLYSQNNRMCFLLERIGYSVCRNDGKMVINKIPRTERATQNPNDSSDPGTSIRKSTTLLGAKALHDSGDLDLLHWTDKTSPAAEAEKYGAFVSKLGDFNMDLFSDTIYHRLKEVEHKARKWQREARGYRDRAHAMQKDSHEKIAFKHFKEGDLALFLPTRNQQAGAWAAFNVGFPHYFLREQDAHRLHHREWLVARITRIQERVVDLSKSLQPSKESDSINDEENDNPFQLSDGLRWYLIDAHEDKPGAPSTPGMGKSTVAANTVAATASIHTHAVSGKSKTKDSAASIVGINKSLSKSLESRRSSSSSKKAPYFAGAGAQAQLKSSALVSETNSLRAAASETPAGTSPVQSSHLSTGEANKALAAASGANSHKSSSKDTKSQQQGRDESAPQLAKSLIDDDADKASEPKEMLERQESTGSPSKKSVIWDELWRVDYSYESPAKK